MVLQRTVDYNNEPLNWMEVIGEANQLPSSKLTTPNERYCAGKKLLEIHSDKSK